MISRALCLFAVSIFIQLTVAAADSDCWWTGCQPHTWGVRGCSPYNRTEADKRECEGGHEFKCCSSADHLATNSVATTSSQAAAEPEGCWWTGCQRKDWAVRGCQQYEKVEENKRDCKGGNEFYCCPPKATTTTQKPVKDSCWWTGCQPKDWAVRGCQQYERDEENKRECKGGNEYFCCPKKATTTETPVKPKCWWTGCQKNDWAVRGCEEYKMVEVEKRSCTDGNEFYCCDKAPSGGGGLNPSTAEDLECAWTTCLGGNMSNVDVCPEGTKWNDQESCGEGMGFMTECCRRKSYDNNINSLTGEPYEDFVKFLFLKENDFSLEPDNLMCEMVDPGKRHVVRIKDEGIRICDMCPHLPQKHLLNIYLDRVPFSLQANLKFDECFGLCYEENKCMAMSYDKETANCYLFDSTAGSFIEDEGWSTVLMTQPSGILQDWTYTRHTRLLGHKISTLDSTNFVSCLSKCNELDNCNFVGYSISAKICSMFSHRDDLVYVDMVYGHIAAFRLSTNIDEDEVIDRFIQDGKELSVAKPTEDAKNKVCSQFKNGTHGAFHSQVCLVSGSSTIGCDQSTGCKVCYYPENTEEFLNLGICPDSEYERRSELKLNIQSKMKTCLTDETCVGVGYNSRTGEISFFNLREYTYREYSTRYLLKYPLLKSRNYLRNYDLVPNAELSSSVTTGNADFEDLGKKTFEQCLELFDKKTKSTKMSYSYQSDSCRLASDKSAFKLDQKSQSIALFKKPSILSPLIRYIRTPGYVIKSGNPRATNDRCFQNCEEVCSKQCSEEHKEWCVYVSLEIKGNSVSCQFYDDESDFRFEMKPLGTILTRTTSLDFTLDSLNKLDAFQTSDFFTCFQNKEGQTQTSLTVFDENVPEGSGPSHFRGKRGIGDFFKKIEEAIVNTVKKVGTAIVDTAKNAAKAVSNLVKGDLTAAKERFFKIPIIDLAKNTVELGGAVVTGDWDEAKKKGMEILDSDGFELVTSIGMPGIGKLAAKGVKVGLKAAQGVAKKGAKYVFKGGKNKIDDIAKNSKKVKNKKGGDKNKPDKKKDEKIEKERGEQCKTKNTRSRRGTSLGRHKRKRGPGDCKNEDEDKPKCARPKIRNVIAKTIHSCDKKNVGFVCGFECRPGFKETSKPFVKCEKSGKSALWRPSPKCEQQSCPAGNKAVISLETPQSKRYGELSLGDFITAFVVQFDKSRKLPDWSVALHQSNQFSGKNYNAAKDVVRSSRVTVYPCKALAPFQATNKDYTKSGWDKGHLTPANVARWSEKAKRVSNLYINVAPQDPYTNRVPWVFLESHIQCFSERRRSIVATGICSRFLPKKMRSISVPACFWKMTCYRDENNNHQVVGFYTSNEHATTDKQKKARYKEVLTPLSQSELREKVGGTFNGVWVKSAKDINSGRPLPLKNLDKEVMSLMCETAMSLSKNEKDAWSAAFIANKHHIKRGKNANSSRRKRETSLSRGCRSDEMKSMLDLMGFFLPYEEVEDEDSESDNDENVDEGDGSTLVNVQNCGKRIVGYYTSWGEKSIGGLELQRLTHVIYAFLEMSEDGSIEIGSADRKNAVDVDEETRKTKRRLERLLQSAGRYPHLRVLFAVGGWENSQYFSPVAASPQKRLTFITSVIKMIDRYGFDGVDVDWEYPVTGGAKEGVPADKENYVTLMKELRTALDNLAREAGRKEKFLISFAGAAGQWTLDPGYDLPNLFKYIDFANIMTYDYFGAWASKWGAYTGPPSPLYFGMPPGFSGKTNADWSVKYYTCKTKQPHKINMGVPFYGRYWNNVGNSVDGKDEMWRTASSVNGVFEGGYVPWYDVKDKYLNNGNYIKGFHEKAKAPYAWNPTEKKFLGYENEQSLQEKVKYAVEKNVGGLMIWALEQDDNNLSLLDIVHKAPLCQRSDPNDVNHKCSPIDEKRWWTPEDNDENAGLCGRSAPLYKGYYPVCDPDDPGYSCCGSAGYCGTGPKYCDCPTCKNYREDPKTILEEPIKPSIPVTWYLMNDADGKRGRCGRKIPKIGSVYPTCNPDDVNNFCCSNGGYCGNTDEHCKCNGCVDFKKKPTYQFGPKKWWTLEDGEDLGGRCGPKAPKVDGIYEAECEGSSNFHCCNPNGWCGSGKEFCDCKGCKDFRNRN